MTASIISIGDELLIGQVVNTNASWLGEVLTGAGILVRAVVAIGDDRVGIRNEISRCTEFSDIVIVSGGLGPTHDDLTRDAICDLLECGMEMDTDQLRRIEQRFADRGIELNERSRNQALAPTACRKLPNEYGGAPGLAFTLDTTSVYALPGVPSELKGIFTDHILPELDSQRRITTHTFLMHGVTESKLADTLANLNELLDESLTLAFLPSMAGIRLRMMLLEDSDERRGRYDVLLEGIRTRGVEWLVSEQDESLTEIVGKMFADRKLTFATAESCTGGLIGATITAIPGCSRYFLGGIVSYANQVKEEQLGVPHEELERYGAVSEEVACSMARGARERFNADLTVAVTGIAGPGGGTEEKPVGTVWIGIASKRGVYARHYLLGKERDTVRQRTVALGLDMLRKELLALDNEG